MQKNSIAAQTLQKLVSHYDEQAAELKKLKGCVTELTRQRDQANARNAELRQTLARYQAELVDARAEARKLRTSAWDDIPVLARVA